MGLRTLAIVLAMPSLPAQAVLNQINMSKAVADPQRDAFNRKFWTWRRPVRKHRQLRPLKQLPTSQLMVGLDSSPAILQFTDHKVVATGHHRNQAAMADVIPLFTGSPAQAGQIAAMRDSDYLVICDGSYELALYERDAPDGFLAQLRRGTLPAWLVRQDDIGAFQVFRVNRGSSASLKYADMNLAGRSNQIVVLLWAVICAVLVTQGWPQITTLSGWDPDDQLRLVQLRDFLNGQSWFDTTQYRLNAPDGAPVHWSRLVELPLALLVLMFRPLFGHAGAEMIAGTTVPLLLLG